ncbi:hypothetical protein BDB01DRAFT_836509 [Pilobolus umbonatus]|nr:hypothetical protein BDB01DRAFT_836509 [Pilobolus umbonatus]
MEQSTANTTIEYYHRTKERQQSSRLLQHVSQLRRSLTSRLTTNDTISLNTLSSQVTQSNSVSHKLKFSRAKSSHTTSPMNNGTTDDSLSTVTTGEPAIASSHTTSINITRQSTQHSALLSCIALEMKRRVSLSDRLKNGIEYSNVFDGKEAVDKLKEIIHTTDREAALRVGHALESQRYFHDINYEHGLVDNVLEIYQFNSLMFDDYFDPIHNNNSTVSGTHSNISTDTPTMHHSSPIEMDEDENASSKAPSIGYNQYIPNGVITELTNCYSPTCTGKQACYSHTCPKRERSGNKDNHPTVQHITLERVNTQKIQPLWHDAIDTGLLSTLSKSEKSRQESIFELIYTEENYLQALDYVINMWIIPLQEGDIIPQRKRAHFIDVVFSNWIDIRHISYNLTMKLIERQHDHPVVSRIGDIMAEFAESLQPFIYYSTKQHKGKCTFEREKHINPKFASFVAQTERHASSDKLEFNAFLIKPVTRLTRYNLLLEKICSKTSVTHTDRKTIPFIVSQIKDTLSIVNNEAGKAKNRYDLKQIHKHLTFKNKKDEVNLQLLADNRRIIKQGTFYKSPSLDSTEYQLILFDHYLVLSKVTIIRGVPHHSIRKRPICIQLLRTRLSTVEITQARPIPSNAVFVETPINKRNSMIREQSGSDLSDSTTKGYPMTFYNYGNSLEGHYTIYAASHHTRKSWDVCIQHHQDDCNKMSVFNVTTLALQHHEFPVENEIHHLISFDKGRQYMLAADSGLYLGHRYSSTNDLPLKLLPLTKVQQVYVLEEYKLLLVLADSTLWEYPLDIVLNGKPQENELLQKFGRKVISNIPFVYVGTCLDKTLICAPKPPSINGTEIAMFEPSMPRTEKKKKTFADRFTLRSSLSFTNTQMIPLKSIYNPYEVSAINTTKSLMILTTPLGPIAINMITKIPDTLLDTHDKHLEFITTNIMTDATISLNQTVKKTELFAVSNGNYLMCYDDYAFFIDKKGKRSDLSFLIKWEGQPTAFVYHYPYIIAFQHHFIEIRSIEDGHLVQVIQAQDVQCIQNSLKSNELFIAGKMADPQHPFYQSIFELELNTSERHDKNRHR